MAASKKEGPAGQPAFEQQLGRLEEIVKLLEDGAQSLEEALKLFEEGVRLNRSLEQILDQAERRVEQLLADGTRAPLPPAQGEGE